MTVDTTYTRFEQRAVKDPAKSAKEGRVVFMDVDFAILTPMGGTDTVERVVDQALLNKWADDGWTNRVQAYDAWKAGQEAPVEGHPLKEWPVATPAEIQTCLSYKIFTVEQLSQANEAVLKKIGMGAYTLQDKAKAWLNDGKGKAAEEIAALKARVKALEEENKRLDEEATELREKSGNPKKKSNKAA